MQIFIGNLAFAAKEQDVYQLFMPFGKISFVKIIMEKKGDKSRGFGFIEMPEEAEAKAAMEALNNKELLGRPLQLAEARSPAPKAPKERSTEAIPALAESPVEKKPREYGFKGKPYFKKPGYKAGRRSKSFAKRRAEKGETTPLPERKPANNPMRWRKNKPWKKKEGEPGPKPWQKKGKK